MAPLRRQVGTLLGTLGVELEGGCLIERVAQGRSGIVRELERRDEAIAPRSRRSDRCVAGRARSASRLRGSRRCSTGCRTSGRPPPR